MYYAILSIFLLTITACSQIRPDLPLSSNLLKLDYEGFTVWLDCGKRGAMKFQYNAQHDTGNEARTSNFRMDSNVPKECQQTSTKRYGQGYVPGHQVSANHLDYSPEAIKQSNYITNILPQAANMNRGAWLLTEKIIECYRDIDELLVIGGGARYLRRFYPIFVNPCLPRSRRPQPIQDDR